MTKLRFILGDQLNQHISSLKDCDKDQDIIFMCEVWDETTYVAHHKKKIALILSAMRHFADELIDKGYRVEYIKLDDPENKGAFTQELQRAINKFSPSDVIVTEPSEYRVMQMFLELQKTCATPLEIRPDDRFLCTPNEFANWAKDRKQLRMEYFYREMRKSYNILMEGDKPLGGKWNFDHDNRKVPDSDETIRPPFSTEPDEITKDVLTLMSNRFANHFGDLEPFHYAVTRQGAIDALRFFIDENLGQFGDFQDAMLQGQAWMFHSHISFYLNCGLLLPLECAKAAEQAYFEEKAPLNAVEGFIRQIIGWREYVRGIYWLKMPTYENENALNAKEKLPKFYWTGETKMNCLRNCVLETKQNAYAHHIQRLMVLGNFALLLGVDPKHVNEWFMIVYADAYQWVELPNVTGMALFADGGYLASKPYASSGAYINKMSNYCKSCSYKVTKKNGPDACPFNYLYWDFLSRNREKLGQNHRLRMIYKSYDRMSEEKKIAISEDTRRFVKEI